MMMRPLTGVGMGTSIRQGSSTAWLSYWTPHRGRDCASPSDVDAGLNCGYYPLANQMEFAANPEDHHTRRGVTAPLSGPSYSRRTLLWDVQLRLQHCFLLLE